MVVLMPTEPPHTRWQLPDARTADEHGLVAIGADLEPGTLLAAYRSGSFPMPITGFEPMAWWSPDPRGVLPLDGLRVTKSLARSTRRYELRVDTAFDAVVAACAEPSRRGGWISGAIAGAYRALFDLGWAHSVEAWNTDGELAGGLYGVAIGAFFAGESMFHRAPDASKVALLGLAERLAPDALLDVQWLTPHLASLGAVEIARAEYLARLGPALRRPLPDAFA
jgi:leucyl/phenylalanyl-tRNA--protein transferase